MSEFITVKGLTSQMTYAIHVHVIDVVSPLLNEETKEVVGSCIYTHSPTCTYVNSSETVTEILDKIHRIAHQSTPNVE